MAKLLLLDPRAENGFSTKGEINMKKMFFAVFALAALSLIAPSTGFAQGDHNQLGWYADVDMSATFIESGAYTTVEVFMVVTNPYNESEGRPMVSITGIEFAYTLADLTVLGTTWANSATALDVATVPGDHIVGWGVPVATVDNVIQLGSKSVLLMVADAREVHLSVISTIPSIPGSMAILDADPGSGDGLQALFPSSGDLANPVFGFNTGDTIVATESTSFDGLKALYR